jgi:c(7)-type cytochrome triheme protein
MSSNSEWLLRARRVAGRLALFVVAVAIGAGAAWGGPAMTPKKNVWLSLAKDGLHDPSDPDLHLLQEPGASLSKLPQDYVANKVNWDKALREGYIAPLSKLNPKVKTRVLAKDVILKNTGGTPWVRFPHKPHTAWLDCSTCHDGMFNKGPTPGLSMFAILNGQYCGKCHGTVAFPLSECNRCHTVPAK